MQVDQTSLVRAWSWRRQGLSRGAHSLESALHGVVAVYSSHPTAPLSLRARSASESLDEFLDLERARRVVRLPAMRESIFLMPVETAPRIFAATRVPREKHAKRLKYAELSWDDYASIADAVARIATVPMTPEELEAEIPTSGKLMVAVKTLSREGLVLRVGGGIRGDALTYVSTRAWIGDDLEEVDPEESLAWLASEYVRVFGPVRTEDFAWWAGVTKTRARHAMRAIETAELADGSLILAEDLEEFERTEPLSGDEIALLPKWDPYTMGYRSDNRRRFIDDVYLPVAYGKVSATRGDGLPLILRGGRAVATWGHRFRGDALHVRVSPFEPEQDLSWLTEPAFASVGVMLGATSLTLEIDHPVDDSP